MVIEATDVLLFLIVTAAFTVESTAGFGATVLTVSIGSHLWPLERVLATFVPVNVVLSLVMVARNRDHIDVKVLVERVAKVMLPGMLLGMGLAAFRGHVGFKAIYGVFIALLAIRELLPSRADGGEPLDGKRRTLALLGAGVVQGLFASGGPLLVYAIGRELADKARFRATLAAVWATLNGLLLAQFLRDGVLTRATLTNSAVWLVPLALGQLLGNRIHDRLNPGAFRRAVFVLLLFAGLSLAVRNGIAALNFDLFG